MGNLKNLPKVMSNPGLLQLLILEQESISAFGIIVMYH